MIKFTNLPVFIIPAMYRFHYLHGRLGLSTQRKPFTLMKFLLKKFQVTKDNSRVEERFVFILALEKVLEKMKDPLYFKKYSGEFQKLEYLIDMYLKGSITNPGLVNWERYDSILPTSESTYGYLNQMILNLNEVFRRENSPRTVRTKSVKTRYIGVGYKDKGKLRISSYDGSPSWQDVSMKEEEISWYCIVFFLRQRYEVDLLNLSDSQCCGNVFSR